MTLNPPYPLRASPMHLWLRLTLLANNTPDGLPGPSFPNPLGLEFLLVPPQRQLGVEQV